MKKIRRFEGAMSNPENKGKTFDELGINHTTFRAYRDCMEVGNELIDFNDVIWERDIPAIAETLRVEEIKEFTISSTFSGLIETLAEFEKYGIKMNGLTEVNARYTDWSTGEYKKIPAIKMMIKEA
jgi:hypothetical protein